MGDWEDTLETGSEIAETGSDIAEAGGDISGDAGYDASYAQSLKKTLANQPLPQTCSDDDTICHLLKVAQPELQRQVQSSDDWVASKQAAADLHKGQYEHTEPTITHITEPTITHIPTEGEPEIDPLPARAPKRHKHHGRH